MSRILDNCKDLGLKCTFKAIEMYDRFLSKLTNKTIN